MHAGERHVGAFEAKTHLASLLDSVERGESVIITRRGRVVARLSPPDDPEKTMRRAQTRLAIDALKKLRDSLPPSIALTLLQDKREGHRF